MPPEWCWCRNFRLSCSPTLISASRITEDGLTDIVNFRASMPASALGMVDKDMIAVRVGPELRTVVVGTPAYFARHPAARDAL